MIIVADTSRRIAWRARSVSKNASHIRQFSVRDKTQGDRIIQELQNAGYTIQGEPKEETPVETWVNPASDNAQKTDEKVASISTVATCNFIPELKLLISSIRNKDEDMPIVVAGDDTVCREIEGENIYTFRLATREKLAKIHRQNFAKTREKEWPRSGYPHCPPACMVKMDACGRALEMFSNTMFLDADFILVGDLDETIVAEVDAAFTPSWHNPKWLNAAENFGRYNAGCVFTRSERFIEWWRNAALMKSKFMDQQCLNLAKDDGFTTAEMGPEHNFGFWRIWHPNTELKNTDKTGDELAELLGFDTEGGEIKLNGEPLKTLHVQMFQGRSQHAALVRLTRHLIRQTDSQLDELITQLEGRQ